MAAAAFEDFRDTVVKLGDAFERDVGRDIRTSTAFPWIDSYHAASVIL